MILRTSRCSSQLWRIRFTRSLPIPLMFSVIEVGWGGILGPSYRRSFYHLLIPAGRIEAAAASASYLPVMSHALEYDSKGDEE